MKTFILASYAPSLVNFRGDLIKHFQNLGQTVVAAAPNISGNDVEKTLTELGVETQDVALSRTGLSPKADLFSIKDIFSKLKKHKPNTILAYTIKPVIWGLIAARLAGVPNRVALITGLGFAFTGTAKSKESIVRWLIRRLYKLGLSCSTLVIFQNEDDRDEFITLGILPKGRKHIIVNGSGVNTTVFSPSPATTQPIRFLLIARMLRDKGVYEFVEAATSVATSYPQVEFHLVGGTDDNPSSVTEAQLKEWNDMPSLTWHGAQDDVLPFLEASSIYVLPSYREGTPRTVLEAMAVGRPIITTNAPGCRTTVEEGYNGFLVPTQNVEMLVERMTWFIENPDKILEFGHNSRQLVEQKFDVHKVNESMSSVMFSQTVSNKSSR